MGCAASTQASAAPVLDGRPAKPTAGLTLNNNGDVPTQQQQQQQVFISYRKADCGSTQGGDGCAVRLKSLLEAAGWTVFLDQAGLEGGDDWEDVLTESVRGCDVFVPILSATYEQSPWCVSELRLALTLNKATVPLWHSGEYPPPKLIMRLQNLQSIPSGRPFDPRTELEDVVAKLTASMKAKRFKPAAEQDLQCKADTAGHPLQPTIATASIPTLPPLAATAHPAAQISQYEAMVAVLKVLGIPANTDDSDAMYHHLVTTGLSVQRLIDLTGYPAGQATKKPNKRHIGDWIRSVLNAGTATDLQPKLEGAAELPLQAEAAADAQPPSPAAAAPTLPAATVAAEPTEIQSQYDAIVAVLDGLGIPLTVTDSDAMYQKLVSKGLTVQRLVEVTGYPSDQVTSKTNKRHIGDWMLSILHAQS